MSTENFCTLTQLRMHLVKVTKLDDLNLSFIKSNIDHDTTLDLEDLILIVDDDDDDDDDNNENDGDDVDNDNNKNDGESNNIILNINANDDEDSGNVDISKSSIITPDTTANSSRTTTPLLNFENVNQEETSSSSSTTTTTKAVSVNKLISEVITKIIKNGNNSVITTTSTTTTTESQPSPSSSSILTTTPLSNDYILNGNINKSAITTTTTTLPSSDEVNKVLQPPNIQIQAPVFVDENAEFLKNYDCLNDVCLSNIDIVQKELLRRAHPENHQYLRHIMYMLKNDICAVYEYRQPEVSHPINEETFNLWFGAYELPKTCLKWLRPERDFIYTAHGIQILKNRYLRPNEPIQYCMLRIAKLFTEYLDTKHEVVDVDVLRVMYDAISCGFIHVSSILADADKANEHIVPGEACRLIVAEPNYDRSFVTQMNEVCNLISLGVGVGMSASTVPLIGYKENGKVHSGFVSFARKLDSCNYLSIYERKPKIAVYLEMHNDTIFEMFELRNPLKHHLENVFFGVMITDHFMDVYTKDGDWYLFPANATINNKHLCDFYGDMYKTMYERFVEERLYSRVIKSSKLMDMLVTSIAETGSPYVIWIDNVNKYNNQRHLGRVKTLNLCAEITNYASPERSSSCTLMSVNFAMYRDFPEAFENISKYVSKLTDFSYEVPPYSTATKTYHGYAECEKFKYPELSKYAYVMGFLSTIALNNMMGEDRDYRELGISPLGVYDMAMIANVDPVQMIGPVSEALYLGAIHASCYFSQEYAFVCKNYFDSPFEDGIPQWELRNITPSISWTNTKELMRVGMANSMLTAQAPTATTSMLVGVSESVTLPISVLVSRESENGRNDMIYYGLICRLLNEPSAPIELKNDIISQVAMYEQSAPYIDQSQSTMFSLVLSRQDVLNLIMCTYFAKLKTGIYYTLPKQLNDTLTIVKSTHLSAPSSLDLRSKITSTITNDVAFEDYGEDVVDGKRLNCKRKYINTKNNNTTTTTNNGTIKNDHTSDDIPSTSTDEIKNATTFTCKRSLRNRPNCDGCSA